RGDEDDAAGRLDAAREPVALRGVGEQAESVAEPLQRSAARQDGALERVAVRRRRLQQPAGRRRRVVAGVNEQEAAGAVGGLRLPGRVAALAVERRLLVAG